MYVHTYIFSQDLYVCRYTYMDMTETYNLKLIIIRDYCLNNYLTNKNIRDQTHVNYSSLILM